MIGRAAAGAEPEEAVTGRPERCGREAVTRRQGGRRLGGGRQVAVTGSRWPGGVGREEVAGRASIGRVAKMIPSPSFAEAPEEEDASTMADMDSGLHKEELPDWMSQLYEGGIYALLCCLYSIGILQEPFYIMYSNVLSFLDAFDVISDDLRDSALNLSMLLMSISTIIFRIYATEFFLGMLLANTEPRIRDRKRSSDQGKNVEFKLLIRVLWFYVITSDGSILKRTTSNGCFFVLLL
ncbi:hypothetical protein EJB05_17193, partial [Eragrostis curvula]